MTMPSGNRLDDDGKVVLDDIYNHPDPRAYFSQLQQLDYRIPGEAQPVFAQAFDVLRRLRGKPRLKVADVGCSYGVNAALMKAPLSMSDLYRYYGAADVAALQTEQLVARDKRLFQGRGTVDVVGLDIADQALAYGKSVGLLDAVICADLEADPLSAAQADELSDVDVIISTGCIGYITERTIGQTADAIKDRSGQAPWMIHFVLRMFAYEPIRDAMADRGYVTARAGQLYRQRKFASAEERESVLDRLVSSGVDPSGLEATGWYYADLFISRPRAEIRDVPASDLLAA